MVQTRWQGWLAAAVVTLVTVALVTDDISNSGFRQWWVNHALTTDTVAGLLVVLVTVLVVNQVARRRQLLDRARAVSAQAAIMLSQAGRASRAVSAALDGSGDRDAASEELRTYMMMLLVGAPVLIDARASRNFLEQAQRLGGEMALSLTTTAKAPERHAKSAARLDETLRQVRTAAAPLMAQLNPAERAAAAGDDHPDPAPSA